jgi:hypothetical protein
MSSLGRHLSADIYRLRAVTTACAARLMPLLLLLALPAVVQAQTYTNNYGIWGYTTNADGITLTITGYTGSGGSVTIPTNIDGLTVTAIGTNAFYNCTSLTNVTIGTNVIGIEYEAFAQCTELTSVIIPGSVTNIGDWAFDYCTSLTNATIGNSVTIIGDYAFLDNFELTSITIPNSVSSIGMATFENCSSVTNVMIGTNVTTIGEQAFMVCSSLAAISVASNNPAFSSVAGVLYDKSQTTVIQCPGAEAGNYIISNSVTSIGDDAFASCDRLTSVTTGDSVVNIGESAFATCSSLTNVTIGTNVTSIGAGAFGSCNGLTTITVATNNPAYSSVAGVLFNKSQTTLIQYPGGKTGSYTVPSSVTSIGNDAFTDCLKLTSATIGDSVTSIGAAAFWFCINLTNVSIGAGLTSIGYDGFDGCYSLTTITVATNNTAFSSLDGLLFNKSQTTLIRCPGGIVGSCTIPSSVTSIGNFAFDNDYKLNSVYFEGNAPGLGLSVFDDELTVYYMPGTANWSSSLGGMPTELWNPQAQTSGDSFGVQTNRFGFNITGASNLVIVVEACSNLASPLWTPVGTNTLNIFIGTNGTSYFSDPQWTNYSSRFYRLRSP